MGTIIRILDSNGEILDSISGEYEDSFSLDDFETLCRQYESANPANTKSFIIARVQTRDIAQPEKEYYSYYDAYHLNKVLFRTQVIMKKKYIHRLHVLNPLTNTDIIGNVSYFMVKPRGPQGGASKSENLHSVISPSVATINNREAKNWTVNRHRIVPELDEPENILPPIAFKNLKHEKSVLDVDIQSLFPLKRARSQSLTITIKIPDADFLATDPIAIVTPATVTRFNIPIDHEKLDSMQKINQNPLLCFRNAVSASVVPESFLEWVKVLKEKSAKTSSPIKEEQVTYDAVLFANDDDFLSSRQVRTRFAENAISEEDFKLFQMKEITGEETQAQMDTISETSRCSVM